MLAILSPAKTLDFESGSPVNRITKPALIADADKLANVLKQQTHGDLQALMGVSEKLAQLNHQRFQDWEVPHPRQDRKAALFAFQGDVYRGLKADQLSAKQIDYAQDHLRILSGLYGVLRPLDGMLPYRLEMGTPLENEKGKNLYEFWGPKIANQLNKQLKSTGSKMLLNLASGEYFKSVDQSILNYPVIAPAFKEWKNGNYKMITVFAKMARGTLASWMIRNKVKTLKKLTQFAEDGYRYDKDLSTDAVPVFVRGGQS